MKKTYYKILFLLLFLLGTLNNFGHTSSVSGNSIHTLSVLNNVISNNSLSQQQLPTPISIRTGACDSSTWGTAITVYMDGFVLPLNDGDILYTDSTLATPYNGIGEQFVTTYTSPNSIFSLSSSGVISSYSVCPVPDTSLTAEAGTVSDITLPTNSVTLDGSLSSDSNGTIVSYLWTIPSHLTITNRNSAITQVTGLSVGAYSFALLVTDNDGNTDGDTVTFNVLGPPLSAGTIGNPQTICSNENPVAFTSIANASGGDGSFVYQWQYSNDGSTNWTDISGATLTTYDPPSGLTASRWYRRSVASNSETKYTSSIKITVNPIPDIAGGSGASIVGPGSATLVATPGTDADNIRWYSASTGGTALVTSTTYMTPVLNTNTTYYVASYNSTTGCEDTDRHPITVIVTIPISSICLSGTSTIEPSIKITNTLTLAMEDGSTINSSDATIIAGFFGSTEVALNQPFNIQNKATFNTSIMGQSYPYSAFKVQYVVYSSSGIHEGEEIISSYDWTQPSLISNFQCSVTSPLSTGTIGNPQTICSNGDPDTITNITGASGGDGSFSYQWQESNDGTNWTDISGATLTTYDPPSGLTASRWYRRGVTSNSETKYTSSVKITVNPLPGLAGGIGVTLSGPGTASLTAIPHVTADNIRWYASSSGGTYLHEGTTYSTPTLNVTTTYYVASYNTVTGCESTVRSPITATVLDPLAAGTIGNSQTICSNDNPNTITNITGASGGDGSFVYQWQYSNDGSTNWTDISGATSTTYNPPSGLTISRWYRRGVTSNSETQYTPSVKVTVNPLPDLASGNGVTLSVPGTAALTAVPHATADNIRWYTTSSGGTYLHEGTTYTTPTLNVTTTYYAASYVSATGCEDTDRHPIIVTINSCSVPPSEKAALEALYDATGGDDWDNNTNWKDPNVPVCDWYGVTVENGVVTSLALYSNNLIGYIPLSIKDLTNIKYLYLFQNQLSNVIPQELGSLSKLVILNLGNNELEGNIPSSFENLLELQKLYLSNNLLTGNIPSGLSNIHSLYEIEVFNNQLFGSIPKLGILSSSQRVSLEKYRFDNNNFLFRDIEEHHISHTFLGDSHGQVPDNYRYSPQAKVDQEETIYINEGYDYDLSTILSSNNNNYQWFFSNDDGSTFNPIGINDNKYTITNASATDNGIYYFTATNNIVTGLTLERNKITVVVTPCVIPQDEYDVLTAFYDTTDGDNWHNNTNWKDPNVPVCDWYGVTVENGHVTKLILNSNKLAGEIPKDLQNLTKLKELNLSANYRGGGNLHGSIPPEIGNLSDLEYLNLEDCKLTGEIPAQLGQLTNLKYLNLNGRRHFYTSNQGGTQGPVTIVDTNEFTGSIPSEFRFLINLEYFNVYDNQLSGEVPSEFINFTSLETFLFSSNKFIFKDFETEHISYTNNLVDYSYSPQAKIDQEETIFIPIGGSYSFTNSLSNSLNNTYQWQFSSDGGVNFTNIANATEHDYSITNVTEANQGVYRLVANNNIISGLTLYRHNYTLIVGEANKFCASEWAEYPTIADLTPSGSNIFWYATETGGGPYDSADNLEEPSGTVYWWDDITDNISTRTAATVLINEGTPVGDDYQFLPTNATIADLQMGGSNVQWFINPFSQTPIPTTEALEHGKTYYAEDVGTSTCRLAVEVYVGTRPPIANNLQYACPDSTLASLDIEEGTIVWYTAETAGSILPDTTIMVEGTTYYAAKVGTDGHESFERTPITVVFKEVNPPTLVSSTREFYSDETPTIANLEATGNNIKWYSQETGGIEYTDDTYVLVNNETYYAEQSDGNCTSERVGLTVSFKDIPKPTIISCEKFKPQIGGDYVISGWVKEQEATGTPVETINFSEVSDLFVDLLNHLKDRLFSSNKLKADIPPLVYIPESDTGNFDALIPYIVGLEDEFKLKVYNFERIEDNFDGINNTGRGRLIGFKFSLNPSGSPVFEYKTPTIIVDLCSTCNNSTTTEINYPLKAEGSDILNFTSARVNNGVLYVGQSFNATNPAKSETNEVNNGQSLFSESITYSDYTETSNQVTNYENAVIELSYIGANGEPEGDILNFYPRGAIIDGWQRIIGKFTIPGDAKLLNINLKSKTQNSVNIYFDDIRVQPYESNMKTFVYHPVTQRLMSELDENNYATFYEYDLEGGLVRIKKETEKGVYTIQETRSGNKKATN